MFQLKGCEADLEYLVGGPQVMNCA